MTSLFDYTHGDITAYGNADDLTYRYVASLNQFQEIDESLNVSGKFNTFGEMIDYAFTSWLKTQEVT